MKPNGGSGGGGGGGGGDGGWEGRVAKGGREYEMFAYLFMRLFLRGAALETIPFSCGVRRRPSLENTALNQSGGWASETRKKKKNKN